MVPSAARRLIRTGAMRVARYPYTAVAAAGATVILNAAYATDTLLDGLGDPITDLDLLDSWAPATGPTFNFTNASAAGAIAMYAWAMQHLHK